jgi:DnaJ homolog subfamily C member 9
MSSDLVIETFGQYPNLYAILGVAAGADEAAIKKAFFKKALIWHPDKAGSDPEATKKFQALTMIHSVLSDPEQRAEYNKGGYEALVGLESSETVAEGANDYWSALFPRVTTKQLEAALKAYRGSADETADVLRFYVKFKGNMDTILESVEGSSADDEDRFVDLIKEAIGSGRVPAMPAFTKAYGGAGAAAGSPEAAKAAKKAKTLRRKAAEAEAAEAEALLAEKKKAYKKSGRKTGAGGSPTLEDLILSRAAGRAAALEALEAKYGGRKTLALKDA